MSRRASGVNVFVLTENSVANFTPFVARGPRDQLLVSRLLNSRTWTPNASEQFRLNSE